MYVLWSVALLWLAGVCCAGADVVVIAHPGVPPDAISRQQLVDIYAGDVTLWDGSARMVVHDLRDRGPTKEAFYAYLGRSVTQMKSVWMRKVLLGEGEPPTAADTEERILELVAATPGAVGYLDAARLTGQRVKRLLVIPTP